MEDKINVFVTYSWDSEEHKDKVLSYVAKLRDPGGYNAEMDRLKSQEETATDFNKMMHQGITDYDKVIIVLSKGYAEKATAFKGGVGTEYQMIIKDIEENSKKYILVSFENISKDIYPIALKGRETIHLDGSKENDNRLDSKIQDDNEIDIPEVAATMPQVQKVKIKGNQAIGQKNLEITSVHTDGGLAQLFGGMLTRLDYNITFEITNLTETIIDQFNWEIHLPENCVKNPGLSTAILRDKVIKKGSHDSPLYQEQSMELEIDDFVLVTRHVNEVLDSTILFRLFSKNGKMEKEYVISEILTYKDNQLHPKMFTD